MNAIAMELAAEHVAYRLGEAVSMREAIIEAAGHLGGDPLTSVQRAFAMAWQATRA